MYWVRKHFINKLLKEFDLVTLPKKDKNRFDHSQQNCNVTVVSADNLLRHK